ncbi:MAG: hypothetical protein ACRDOG_07295 [Gaiellaceae bacterium]
MLRAVATWAVAAAVAAVGVAAFVDALSSKPAARSASTRTPTPPLGAQLREAGVTGVLVYADERCRLHAVRLPSLDLTEVPEAAGGPFRAPGSEPAAAGCTIPASTSVLHPPTWIEGGRVLQLVPCSREALCRRVLLSRGDLARAASNPFARAEEIYVARELAWVSGDHLAVLVGGSYPDFVAVFRDRTFLYRMFSGFQPRSLRASPLGRYIVVEDDGPQVVRVGKSPRNVAFPEGLTTVRAVAWSPGEQWLAVATRASIWLMHLEEPGIPLIRLPIEARELGWIAP